MSGFDAAALAWRLQYEISPIVLTGSGLAANVPGGMVPIVSLTQPGAFPFGLLSPGGNIDMENGIRFTVLPGATTIEQQFGEYPFANQAVAANAVIAQPLHVSMMMICPEPWASGGMFSKAALLTALIKSLTQHNQTGGTYSVLTPSYLYTNCLLRLKQDAGSGDSLQPQIRWRMDFEQPLLTLQQAQQAQNNLMSKLSSQTMLNGQPSWSGQTSAVGNSGSGQAPATVPAASPQVSASTAPPMGGGAGAEFNTGSNPNAF